MGPFALRQIAFGCIYRHVRLVSIDMATNRGVVSRRELWKAWRFGPSSDSS